jgi:hypothetical protein
LPPKTSALLKDLRDAFPGEEPISVRDLLKRLDGRAFGLLLLILALPNCIPNVPGISTVFGLLLVAPALQMIFGAGTPWIPKRIANMRIEPSTFRKVIDWTMPNLLRVEKLVQPRLQFLTQKPATIWFGIQTLILAGILVLPIPFANWPPGMGVATLAIALVWLLCCQLHHCAAGHRHGFCCDGLGNRHRFQLDIFTSGLRPRGLWRGANQHGVAPF